MFSRSLASRLKSIDVYKRLPKELSEPTISGALVSIMSLLFILVLFFSELNQFLSYKVTSEMNVELGQQGQKIKVNMDIILTNMPCQIVSVDIMDIMGKHEMHMGGSLQRNRLDKNGNVIERSMHITENEHKPDEDHTNDVDFNQLVKSLDEQEGCQLLGYIVVNKVPGNFHLSSHAFGNVIRRLFTETKYTTIDLSHKINHLSFGEESDIKMIKTKFNEGVLNPLDGTYYLPQDRGQGNWMYEYYLKVVPTTYFDIKQNKYMVHQFTSNSHKFQSFQLPAIFFRYDLSPVNVTYIQSRERFFHFLVQLCAIIGGVFTVAGIIDAIVHKSVVHLIKKAELGKLS